MDTRIRLNRAHMSQGVNAPNPVDVTVKSAIGIFKQLAPSWPMVMKHKAGKMTDAIYSQLYAQMLHHADWVAILKEIKHHEYVTFLCYCPDGAFCHTHLLIDHILKRWPETFIDGRKL